MGGEADVIPFLVARYFGLRSFSVLYALTWTVYAIAGAIGPVLMGKAFDASGSYATLLVWIAGAIIVVAPLMLVLPRYEAPGTPARSLTRSATHPRDAHARPLPSLRRPVRRRLRPPRRISTGTSRASTGTFVLLDGQTGAFTRWNAARADQRFAPCSTFKIPNTAILLETGAAADPEFVVKYDPALKASREAWRQDHTLRSAYRDSVLWYYHALSKKAGLPAEARLVKQFGYGNADTSGGVADDASVLDRRLAAHLGRTSRSRS